MNIHEFIMWFIADVILCVISGMMVATENWGIAVFTGLLAIICSIKEIGFMVLMIWKHHKKG